MTLAPREYESLPEPEIIGRCQTGDREAFNILIRRYETRVLNLAMRFLRDYHHAVDETQEIFLKVFRKIGLFKGESAFGTWLYRITVNHCLNVVRTRRRRQDIMQPAVSLDHAREESFQAALRDPRADCPEAMAMQQELRNALLEMIHQLGSPQREVLILCHFEAMRYDEAAAVLNVPVSTVRSAMYRARQQLRALMVEKGGYYEKRSR